MGRYKCIYCGTLGFTWKQMKNHIETLCALRGKREKHLGCPYCPLVFHIRNMYTAHMLAHTDKGSITVAACARRCSCCVRLMYMCVLWCSPLVKSLVVLLQV